MVKKRLKIYNVENKSNSFYTIIEYYFQPNTNQNQHFDKGYKVLILLEMSNFIKGIGYHVENID